MQDVDARGLHRVDVKVFPDGVGNVFSDHSLHLGYLSPLGLVGRPPHELQGVVDSVHRSPFIFEPEAAVAQVVLGDEAHVAGLPRAAAGSLAVA